MATKQSKYLRLTKLFDAQYGSIGTVRDTEEYPTVTRLFRLVGVALGIPSEIVKKALEYKGKVEGNKFDGVAFVVRKIENDRVLSATPAEPYEKKSGGGNPWDDDDTPAAKPESKPENDDEVPF